MVETETEATPWANGSWQHVLTFWQTNNRSLSKWELKSKLTDNWLHQVLSSESSLSLSLSVCLSFSLCFFMCLSFLVSDICICLSLVIYAYYFCCPRLCICVCPQLLLHLYLCICICMATAVFALRALIESAELSVFEYPLSHVPFIYQFSHVSVYYDGN